MELKSGVRDLKIVADMAENLVEQLKIHIVSNKIRVGAPAMDMAAAKSFIDIIAANLEGTSIDGDELVLDDIIAIYDRAITAIGDELARDSALEAGDKNKFNQATIDSFENVKEALKDSKGKIAGPLMEVLGKLVEQNENGTLEEEYRLDRINDIDADIQEIDAQISEESQGLLSFGAKIKPEIEAYEKILNLNEEYFTIKKEIEEIDNKLADPNLTPEEKQEYEAKKMEKEKRLVAILKEVDEKYEKDDAYKQGENESDRDYLARIQSKNPDNDVEIALRVKENDLQKKLETLKDTVIKIYNPRSKKFEEIKVSDYIDINNTDSYKLLSSKIKADKIINRDAQKDKIEKREELIAKKAKFNSQQLLARTPGKMGFFSKFKKRREFFRNEGEGRFKSFFKSFSKKEDEKVFRKEAKKFRMPSDWKESILVTAEELLKKGNDKQTTMANVKAKLFGDRERDD